LNNLYYKDPYNKDRYDNYNRGNNLNYLNRIKTNTPDILILLDVYDDDVHNYLDKDGNLTTLEYALNKKYNELRKFKDKIVFNGYIYKLDSMIITNYNAKSKNHGIAGITCNNVRYVYNGWRRGHDVNSHPCSLFKHNWSNSTYSKGFCLPTANNGCELTRVNDNNLCFNFSKRNIRRIFFYVKHKKSSSYFTFSNNSHTDIKKYTTPDIDEARLNDLINETTTTETNLVNNEYRNTERYKRINDNVRGVIGYLKRLLKENSKIINPIWHYERTYTYIADIDHLLLPSEDIKDHMYVQIHTLVIEDLKKESSEIFNYDQKTYIKEALLYMFFSTMRSDKDYEIKKEEIVPIYNTIKNVNAIFNFFSEDDIADLDNKYELFINNKFYETDEIPVPVEINNQGGKRKPKKTRKN
jgi:hypothetical protein